MIVRLFDGSQVVVPDAPGLMTSYVLREQEDWFEEEIRFVRRVVQPGNQALDIGASGGLYTLAIATAAGTSGQVWAYEPTSTMARCLEETVGLNRLSQVTVIPSALAEEPGEARLILHDYSELNVLDRRADDARSERVKLTTLDAELAARGWERIDLVKLDVGGAEARVVAGGKRFFAELSPLVQFNIKTNGAPNLGSIENFAELGYETYRLVPGLNLLMPFHLSFGTEGYLLNLFCCKPDRAAQLEEAGYLVRAADPPQVQPAYNWRFALAPFPYAAQLSDQWERTVASGGSAQVEAALALYSQCQDDSQAPDQRLAALEGSFQIMHEVCQRDSSRLRLASLARIARDYGVRSLAVQALGILADAIVRHEHADVSEPFLLPTARFDPLPTGPVIGNWVYASVLEALEQARAFSSFFSGPNSLPALETLAQLGMASPEMQRRLTMVRETAEMLPTNLIS